MRPAAILAVLAVCTTWARGLAFAALAGVAAGAGLVVAARVLGLGHTGLLVFVALAPIATAAAFVIPPRRRSPARAPRRPWPG